MRRIILVSLFCMTAAGCQSAPEESRPESAAAPEGRGGEMPASLRCRQAADCVQKPSCYWDTPACVASASVVGTPEKCSGDADPADAQHQPVRCDCFEGQCTVKSTP